MSSDLSKLLVDMRARNLHNSNRRNSDHEEIAMCAFEVLMSAYYGCRGFVNIDSGAKRFILRLCA